MNMFFDTKFTGLVPNLSHTLWSTWVDSGRKNYEIYENSISIKYWLEKWLEQFGNQTIQLVSDVCHYDMALFCNLFGGPFSLPSNINPVCYDICGDISCIPWLEAPNEKLSEMTLSHCMRLGFDKSREELCTDMGIMIPDGKKHNALYDAKVTKAIFEQMSSYHI